MPAGDHGQSVTKVAIRASVLTSAIPHFGGLSGLELADDPAQLIAISDRGWAVLLEKVPPHAIRGLRPIGGVPQIRAWQDAESLRRAPDGRLWVAFEGQHRIVVHCPGWTGLVQRPQRSFRLPNLHELESNRGIEALAMLPDGRALALSETRRDGLAFVLEEGGRSRISKRYNSDFPPVDAVALANGGLLVLVRTPVWPLPPLFATRIDYVEPGWEDEETIQARPLFRIDTALPAANFEGMALEPIADGGLRLWLISDDNFLALQDTVLAWIDMPSNCLKPNIICQLERVIVPPRPSPTPRSRPNPVQR